MRSGVQIHWFLPSPWKPQGQGCVAFLPLGASIHLKVDKPKSYSQTPTTLGEHLLRERTIRHLHQDEAAKVIGVCEATYLNWEKDQRKPAARQWPAVIKFIGTDPHPEPKTLCERMAATRRAMGWSMRAAARTVGIDEGTWRSLESQKRSVSAQVRASIEQYASDLLVSVHDRPGSRS